MRKSLLSKLLAMLATLASSGAAQSNGSVSGEVADQTDAVLAQAPVELRSPQLSRRAETSSVGRFEFTSVPPGQYAVIFSLPGFYTKVLRIGVASGEELALGTIQLRVIGYPYDYDVPAVRILDPSVRTGNLVLRIYGYPDRVLSGARVTLFCRGTSVSCGAQPADRDGRVRFEGLEDGDYRVSVTVEGYYDAIFGFFVSSGVEHEFRYFLEKCVEPTCDPAKRPVAIQLE